MLQPDVDAIAGEVVSLIKSAMAPVLATQGAHMERIAALEAKGLVVALQPAPDIAPEDIAASVAGLLRKELADLEIKPTRTSKRIVRDARGHIERVIEEAT